MLLLTQAVSNDASLRLLGLVNAWVLNGRFSTATLFYLADSRYLESVTFRWYAKRHQWSPVLGGIFFYSGAGGFICVMGCNEVDLFDPENAALVMRGYVRMERIARLLRVDVASYAGILPSVLAHMGVRREPIEADRTVLWIREAIEQVIRSCGMSTTTRIAILGSQGHVGKRLTALMKPHYGTSLIELDNRRADHAEAVMAMAASLPVVLVNAARDDALGDYLNLIPPGSVILNEVYPECRPTVLSALKMRSIRYFHICGVAAFSFPGFPRAYAGAVPCCAASAIASTKPEEGKSAVVVLREW